MKKILVLNGPNLNLLGNREAGLYGTVTLAHIQERMLQMVKDHEVSMAFFQSNHEGELIDELHAAQGNVDCIIINAGGLTHTSVALHDAIRAVQIPTIEVHMTNIYAREEFRHKSLISPAAVGGIFGFGEKSYYLAVQAAIEVLEL